MKSRDTIEYHRIISSLLSKS